MPRRPQRTGSTPIGLWLVLAMVVAACGTAGESADTTAAAPDTTAAAPDTTAAGPDTTAAAPDTTVTDIGDGELIVIGHTGGMTGFMSVFDVPFRNGLQLGIDVINESGGIMGRQVELVTSNHETDFTKLQTSALEVIEAGADFVTVSCDYDVGGPAATVANENGLIAIGCAGGPLFGVEGVGPLTYNLYHGSPAEGALLAEFAWDQGWRNPFVLVDESLAYTLSIAEYFEKRWEELSREPVIGTEVFLNSDASIATQAAAAADSGADVILLASYPPGGPGAIRQLYAAGVDVPMLGPTAFDGGYWLEAVPDIHDFFIPTEGSLWGDDPSEAINEWLALYAEVYGDKPASMFYPLAGYSAAEALKIAIEAAGSTETEAVAAELNKFDEEPLLVGATTWTETCHVPRYRPLLIIEYAGDGASVLGQRAPESVPESPC